MVALARAFRAGSLPHLERLILGNNAILGAGVTALADAIDRGQALRRCVSIDLGANAIGDEGMVAFSKASQGLPLLENLTLNDNEIALDGMAAFAAAVRGGAMGSLVSLDLSSNSIGHAGLTALAEAIRSKLLPQLKELYVDDVPPGTAAAATFMLYQ